MVAHEVQSLPEYRMLSLFPCTCLSASRLSFRECRNSLAWPSHHTVKGKLSWIFVRLERARIDAMKKKPVSGGCPTRNHAKSALWEAFATQQPGILDERGYVCDFLDTLLPMVLPEDFEDDVAAGDGNELQTKFRAAHSSTGLAVNCFAPFRRRLNDIVLPGNPCFDTLRFERKCPTGLRGTPPNLDVLLEGPDGIVGIESKLTEYLSRHQAKFATAYEEQINDSRREQGYFAEMLRLKKQPDSYAWLDAAQLIKHAFGLTRTFSDRPVTLLYLFWEPVNPEVGPEFAAHRGEIEAFAARMVGSVPTFKAMSYPELWQSWRDSAFVPEWLHRHLEDLQNRYLVQI